MTYHAIGDSNCLYNFYHLPNFEQHHLGSVRMRDVVDGTCRIDLAALGVQPGDKCFFTFGEIDVRCDLHRDIGELAVGKLVEGYIAKCREAALPGVEIWIVSILPTAYIETLPDWVRYHPQFPYVGGDQDRVRYTAAMNGTLMDAAKAASFRYLDIHHRYADERGMMRPELGAYMHVGTNQPILEEMRAMGLYSQEAEAKPALAAVLSTTFSGGGRLEHEHD